MSISRSTKSAALLALALAAGILATSNAAFAGGRGGYRHDRRCWYDYHHGRYQCSGGHGHGHGHH